MYDRHMHAYDKAHVTVKWNAQDKKSVLFIIKNVKNNRVDRGYGEQVVLVSDWPFFQDLSLLATGPWSE